MPTSRILAGALVAGGVAVASVFAAAPVSAATLPSGQRITVIDHISEGPTAFYEASPVDASLSAVGELQDLGIFDLTGVDVDDEGHGYAIGNTFLIGGTAVLYTADANTGVLSNPLQIMLDFGDVQVEAGNCSALDYTDGIIMAICFEDVEEVGLVAYWGIIDPAAAEGEAWLTPLYQFDSEEYLNFTAMAVDPISGLVYAIAVGEGAALFTLSQDAGATFVTGLDRSAWGFDFDRGGQAWVTTQVEGTGGGEFPPLVSALATLNLADGSNPFLSPMQISGEQVGEPLIQPITVWGNEVLPATGASNTLPVAAGAAAVLLLGAVLAAGAVRHRRTDAH